MKTYQETLISACNESFQVSKRKKKIVQGKTVAWWTQELTIIMRKKVNALRRRYQKTKNNEILREERKAKYVEEKNIYMSRIKQEKIKSWKQYCNLTNTSNPWNSVYKVASGKIRNSPALTTIRKSDGSYSTDIESTMECMMEYFIPKDGKETDNEYHKQIRSFAQEEINTSDDTAFTQNEILDVIKKLDNKKAPGEDAITGEIILRVFQMYPLYVTTIYNECLNNGLFPKTWKRSLIIPIVKPGKEESDEPSKFRPISLINVGGKILEKLLINRIMHYVYSNQLMNRNQYGFIPQSSTVDAIMAVKDFVEKGIETNSYIVIVSLDVKGAFDAAYGGGHRF